MSYVYAGLGLFVSTLGVIFKPTYLETNCLALG
jgi:hypothetical protein